MQEEIKFDIEPKEVNENGDNPEDYVIEDKEDYTETENEDFYNIEKALTEKEENKEKKIITKDYKEESLEDYEKFDKKAWQKGEGYKIPNFPIIEEKLEGAESGFYIFAGESNSGKSAIMMNIQKDMCSYEDNHLLGVYLSLDDSKDEIIPRIIAMEQSIPISVVTKPQKYANLIEGCDNDNIALYTDYLEKRQKGLEKIIDDRDIFKIQDASKIKNSTDLRNYIIQLQTDVKSVNKKNNIIVAIDAINDIKLDPNVYGRLQGNDKAEEIAKFVKDLSVELDCIIFASSHLRKLNGNRRPTLDDLKEANTLLYEASLVWLVYNDVSKNKGAAKIYWNDSNADNNFGAVIELDWSKNKKSSYKGRTFCMFMPYYSKCIECNKEVMKNYEARIYQG